MKRVLSIKKQSLQKLGLASNFSKQVQNILALQIAKHTICCWESTAGTLVQSGGMAEGSYPCMQMLERA